MERKWNVSEDRGKNLAGTITKHVSEISKLTHEKQEITDKLYATSRKLT